MQMKKCVEGGRKEVMQISKNGMILGKKEDVKREKDLDLDLDQEVHNPQSNPKTS